MISVEDMAGGLWTESHGHGAIHHLVYLVHLVGIIVRLVECLVGTHVCAICLRLWHTGDQDHFIGLHYTRLFGQMDFAD